MAKIQTKFELGSMVYFTTANYNGNISRYEIEGPYKIIGFSCKCLEMGLVYELQDDDENKYAHENFISLDFKGILEIVTKLEKQFRNEVI
jgi:hypothetical protein